MTEFIETILADAGGEDILTSSGFDILVELTPSGNLSLTLTSGDPVTSERGLTDREYKTGQIEIHPEGGFLIMSDNYALGETFAASKANGTAVYNVPNYNGTGFERGFNVYVELNDPNTAYESSTNPYYGLTSTTTATTRFLGRAERAALPGSNSVFIRTMAPKFGE